LTVSVGCWPNATTAKAADPAKHTRLRIFILISSHSRFNENLVDRCSVLPDERNSHPQRRVGTGLKPLEGCLTRDDRHRVRQKGRGTIARDQVATLAAVHDEAAVNARKGRRRDLETPIRQKSAPASALKAGSSAIERLAHGHTRKRPISSGRSGSE